MDYSNNAPTSGTQPQDQFNTFLGRGRGRGRGRGGTGGSYGGSSTTCRFITISEKGCTNKDCTYDHPPGSKWIGF